MELEQITSCIDGLRSLLDDDQLPEENILEAAMRIIAEQQETINFIERWAVYHANKPINSPDSILNVIQNHPAIKEITKSYKDR